MLLPDEPDILGNVCTVALKTCRPRFNRTCWKVLL